ncbi:cytochrome P450 (plasmid) [Nostoc sp. UHCC 0926]|uniref:cytochrome P450 n=1 Tax=Nostoc sp. UHCC 0926 TaxID=3025190 RepID=UPI00236206A8|nr:cytochrome P450 [Nostoc sp. UHCC 0926]WDD36961.1 cytochrome P450 [Nostoc sp. UHCC 0926]
MQLPPGPKTSTWLLNLQFAADPFGYMDAIGKRYGDIFTIMVGSTPVVIVSNPQGIKEIFTKKEIISPGELNRGLSVLDAHNGLLSIDGLRHKHRRKLLMPPLHGERMRVHGQQICALTEKVMNERAIGKPFLVFPTMQVIALQVILEVLFGLDNGERYKQIGQLIFSTLSFLRSRLTRIVFSFPYLQQDLGRWSPWGYYLRLRQEFDQLVYTEINERREQPERSRSDILSQLVFAQDETGESLTNRDVRDLLPSFIIAGRNTEASAIAWALYWIHKKPAVRDQLLQELDSLGECLDPISIVGLPYLSAVCNEVLRINPIQIQTLPRRAESPIELMGYELSPGTILRGGIYLTHQREDLYPNPKEFKPERFLERQFSPYEFLPFGGGARRCPGEAFGLFEMKLVLATILSRYQLALVDTKPERPMRLGLNYAPARGLKMVIVGQRQRPAKPQQFVVGSV